MKDRDSICIMLVSKGAHRLAIHFSSQAINNLNAFVCQNSEIPRKIRKAFDNLKDFNTFNILAWINPAFSVLSPVCEHRSPSSALLRALRVSSPRAISTALNTLKAINAFPCRNSEIPRKIRKAFDNLKDFNTIACSKTEH